MAEMSKVLQSFPRWGLPSDSCVCEKGQSSKGSSAGGLQYDKNPHDISFGEKGDAV